MDLPWILRGRVALLFFSGGRQRGIYGRARFNGPIRNAEWRGFLLRGREARRRVDGFIVDIAFGCSAFLSFFLSVGRGIYFSDCIGAPSRVAILLIPWGCDFLFFLPATCDLAMPRGCCLAG